MKVQQEAHKLLYGDDYTNKQCTFCCVPVHKSYIKCNLSKRLYLHVQLFCTLSVAFTFIHTALCSDVTLHATVHGTVHPNVVGGSAVSSESE